MPFVPSRDLPTLSTKGCLDTVTIRVSKIKEGLHDIENAFGLEDEEQHIWINDDSSDARRVKEEELHPDDNDEFELSSVRRWLSSVACMKWLSLEEQAETSETIEEMLNQAAKLIAICAGKCASGKATRVHHFIDRARDDIKIKIQDQAVTQDSLGSRTWEAAPLLASRLLQGHHSVRLRKGRTLRVLELGAGTGLVGLAISKYLDTNRELIDKSTAEIVLTDFNDDVLVNLQNNVALNALDERNKVDVRVCTLDWSDPSSSSLGEAKFDLIVAADHAHLIKDMVMRYLSDENAIKNSSDESKSSFVLMCPIRPTHHQDLNQIYQVFPLQAASSSSSSSSSQATSGLTLCITHQQDLYGYDDFGPPLLRTQSGFHSSYRNHQRIPYREFIIQWCPILDK